MIKKITTISIGAAVFWLFNVASVYAQGGLVPCSGLDCTASDIVGLIDNIIQNFLLPISWVLGAVGFAVAGFFLLTSGGNTGRIETGKKMLWGVLWGLLLVHTAYLIVKSIISVLSGGPVT